jgi:Asp-tRNA(Asn)/Glu-tRNA(Gln) amidotransferase C subunit
MSDYYDIKKLCVLSRLEIDDSEIQQTDDKIKEIITFFNKLDEFEINEKNSNNQDIVNAYASDNYLKLEKKMIDLRDDLPIKKIDSNFGIKEDISFNFKFHDKRNGYVIGPRM